jgi:hypothetical protein
MPMSGAVWLAIAAGVMAIVVIVRLVRGKGAAPRLEVGSVSDQWVAEHRRDSDPHGR